MAALLSDRPAPLPLTDAQLDRLHWVCEVAFRRVCQLPDRCGAREARIAAGPRALAMVDVAPTASRAQIATALADASNAYLGELIRRRWRAAQRRSRASVA